MTEPIRLTPKQIGALAKRLDRCADVYQQLIDIAHSHGVDTTHMERLRRELVDQAELVERATWLRKPGRP